MNEEIEQSHWATYLDEFSKRNQMRPARLGTISATAGVQEEALHLPLVGVSFERKGGMAGSAEIILGGLTAADTRHLTHTIRSVRRVVPKPGPDGREDALEIEGEDGAKTLLIFEQLPQLAASIS